MWLIFAFGSAFFAGLTAILSKQGVKNIDSNLATALRTIIVFIFSWLMVFVVGSQGTIEGISGMTVLFLILSGLATGASWLCYFKALQMGDVNKVTPIDKSSTILTMLLAFIFLNENLTIVMVLAMLMIGMGTYLMIEKKESKNIRLKNNMWILYAFGSALFASLTSILGKVGIQGVESNLGTAIRTIVVLIMAWVIVFITKKQDTIKDIDRRSGVFLVLSGFTTGGSWLCYYRALQDGPASVVVPIDKLSILITIIFSYLFLNEKLTRKSLIGLVLIVAGIFSLLIK